ncbi:hypothetical protein [Streptomyces sp. x-19]|uniref:hypothetical protein n=1 Tax=Streptomyces sp. x-19 TaxID=2789280 RepID=UPI0039811CC4
MVGTLLLVCSLCGAAGPLHVQGDDLDNLTLDAREHLARHHPESPADILVMHQHTASGTGTPNQVAQWARGLRSAVNRPLTE